MRNIKLLTYTSLFFILSIPTMALPQFKNCNLKGSTYKCLKNVKYASHKLQSLDIWKPNNNSKNTLVIYIHGGGYFQGEKESAYSTPTIVDPRNYLNAGYAFATIDYRLSGDFPYEKGVTGMYPAAMADGARAIQFLRHKASELGFDKKKVVVTGQSAGGGITLWNALHTDLKKTNAGNAVLRESSKVSCVALYETQTTINIKEVSDLLGPYGFELDSGLPALYGFTKEEYLSDPDYYNTRFKSSFEEASPLAHLTSDDNAKIIMTYMLDLPSENIHSPNFGVYAAYGVPYALKDKYKRKSFRELGNEFELHIGQSARSVKNKVLSFVKNKCFK